MSFLINIKNHLYEGEEILAEARYHWIFFFKTFFLLFLGILILLSFSHSHYQTYFRILGYILLIAGLLDFLVKLFKYLTTNLIVTNKRVVIQEGIFFRDIIEMNLQKLESVQLRQSILGRILNYGYLYIKGSGATVDWFGPISSPVEIRTKIKIA